MGITLHDLDVEPHEPDPAAQLRAQREHDRALRAHLIAAGILTPAADVPDRRGDWLAARLPTFTIGA